MQALAIQVAMRSPAPFPHTGAGRSAAAAFTLIELLVVTGIVVVLAALLFPAFSSMRESGKKTTCLAHMRQVGAIVLQYSADNNNRMLPAISGKTARMDEDAWYELLEYSGQLPANPRNPNNEGASLWGGKWNSIMTCPSRKTPARDYWTAGVHDLHYAMNQHPGFLNRGITGSFLPMTAVARPSRTFMLAESTSFLTDQAGANLVYPHKRSGEGMNLVFYDGHSEYFKGKLPVLPGGNYVNVPYDTVPPEKSFPWY